jgi:hypothetical protein
VTASLKDYQEARDFREKEHPAWLRAMSPRRINVPSEYWPQKVWAISATNAAMMNAYLTREKRTRPNPALVAVQGQAGLLLKYDAPTYFVSRELLAAALRTELPDDMVFDAIPFPFPAMVFMLPRGVLRHPSEGDCPFLVISRVNKGESAPIPIKELEIKAAAEQDAVIVTTYMPEAPAHVTYFKSVPVLPDQTIKASFEKASHVPFTLLINEEFAESGEGVDLSSEDFIDQLWLLAVTLVLIMVSGENLLEPGKLLKTVKTKTGEGPAIPYWSPNFLGRVYRAGGNSAQQPGSGPSQRAHWKRGHIKSQPYGSKRALRKIIWIQPYRAGSG